jgi:predicted permease
MNSLFDLRLAVRSLVKRPAFSLIVILTMAIGIGSNVAVFSYLSYWIWPTMDAPRPHELVRLETRFEGERTIPNSYPDWLEVQGENRVFDQLAAFRLFGSSVRSQEQTLHAWGHAVSGDYFALFGAQPEVGRLIQPTDDREDAERVVVLNHLFWTRHFGADASVLGRTVYLNGRLPYTIIGVAPPRFQGQGVGTEIYVPLATAEEIIPGLDNRQVRLVQSIGRLSPDVTIERARASLTPLASGLDELYPEEESRQFKLTPISEPVVSILEDPIVFATKILMAAVALLLLLACANVANLLLARSEARSREMGILAALGAGRTRLSGRLLTESLLLSVTGGMLGLLIGYWSIGIIEYYLLQTVPVGMGTWGQSTRLIVDERAMILFAVGVSVATGLVFGLAPVTRVLRTDLVTALKSSASSPSGKKLLDMRRLLVVTQVALSVVLLLGAALLVQTLLAVHGQNIGFESRNLMLATVYMPADRSADDTEGVAAYEDILEATRAMPGVEAASLVQLIPLSWISRKTDVKLPHLSEPESTNYNVVGPDYFEAMKIPLLQGREFQERDREDSPGVVVINEAAARQWWEDRTPIGQRVSLRLGRGADQTKSFEVVGVAADSRYERIVDPIRPQIYLTYKQRYRSRLTFVVRTSTPIASELRAELNRSYPDLAIIDLVPFSEQLRRSFTDQRMNADIASSFGALGLLLAATGIFSVMSYTVSRRRREFGIRMAMGGTALDMTRQVLREAGRLIALGVVIGLGAAWALAKILAGVLYGVSSNDPITFITVPAALAIIGLTAAWLPARRAAQVNPISALREE